MNKPTAILLTLLALPCALMAGTGSGISPSGVWVDTRTGNLPALTVTMRRVKPEALANAVQGTDIDEELRVNTTNLAALSNQPEIQGKRDPWFWDSKTVASGGLVADGVTPLIFEVSGNGAQPGTTYEVTLTSVGDGTYNGDLNTKLQLLSASMSVSGTRFTLPSQSSRAYLYLSPLKAEDLSTTVLKSNMGFPPTLVPTFAPVVVDMKVWDVASRSKPVATFRFGIRKPPVVLVHGFNTDATAWTGNFTTKVVADRGFDFVNSVDYGVKRHGDYVDTQQNTTWSLESLIGVLDTAISTEMAGSWCANWAFTRFDAVGHSQGGILLRLLCSQNPAGELSCSQFPAFRNRNNCYRGRFRRVVTIVSPHAGSTLNEMGFQFRSRGVAWGGVTANVVDFFSDKDRLFQRKFQIGNGSELDKLNSTLQCDPLARLHLLAATIYDGKTPDSNINTFADLQLNYYSALRLNKPTPTSLNPSTGQYETPGVLVAPYGSDGVVDLNSQTAGGVSNSSTITGRNISHAVIGKYETEDSVVADRVIALINGPSSQFGPVTISDYLKNFMEDRRNRIQALALAIQTNQTQSGGACYGSSSPAKSAMRSLAYSAASAEETLNFTLQPPVGESPNGPVEWNAVVYGPTGVSNTGLTLTTNGTYGEQLAVTVAAEVQGQVVLGVIFPSTSGQTVVGTTQVVLDRPPGDALTAIMLDPATIQAQAGTEMPLAVWGIYDGSISSRLFTNEANTAFQSSDENVATVDASGRVKLVGLGTATINATYTGSFTATAAVTVLDVAPVVTSNATLSGTVGTTFSHQITASQAVQSFAVSSLPTWLTLDAQTGLLTGTPTQEGLFSMLVSATNANGTGTKQVDLTITGTPGAPTDIGLSAAAISENKPTGTVVGQFATTDPNPLDTFTYQLVSGTGATDNALFSIASNQLLTAAVLNHATKPSVSIRVRSTDSTGLSVEKAIVLPVLTPPAITRQPDSRQVFAGDDVTFFVEATGVEPLSFQWNIDGQAIPDANSRILELPGAMLEDSGNYTVTVSNGDGSVTSNAASLVVDAASYGKWASTLPQAVASAVLEPNGDYNGDGIPNYLDFAFGVQSGLEPATAAQPYITSDAAGFLLIYREANGIAPPVYRIMKSTDMTAWQQHLPSPVDVTRTDKGAYTEVQVRVPSGGSKLFLKVQVSGQ